jgi:hypothetical protein
MKLASTGFGSATRTVYISRLLCINMLYFSSYKFPIKV